MKLVSVDAGPPTGRTRGCGDLLVLRAGTEDKLHTEIRSGLESYFQLRLYSEDIGAGGLLKGF